jgi:hypothetical protein
MKNTVLFTFLFLIGQALSFSQNLSGQLSGMPEQGMTLKGFKGVKSYVIDSIITDANGKFKFEFNKEDYGMGLLVSENNKPFIAVLANEDVVLNGESTSIPESIQITKGPQNKAFMQYAKQQPKREQALSAWTYLQKMYKDEDLFNTETEAVKTIHKEIKRIHAGENNFLDQLPKDSYLQWYIPVRKLLSSVAQVAQSRTEDIPATREALRAIDYSDERLYKSGLLKDALDNHVWFIENSSGNLDLVFEDLNTSINIMYEDLIMDEAKFNEVTDYLFNLLEKRSLFTSAEYLAFKVLNDQSCTLNENVIPKLKAYMI